MAWAVVGNGISSKSISLNLLVYINTYYQVP